MIQGSINQLLQSAAIFGRLAPGYEQKIEARQARKQISGIENQLTELSKRGSYQEGTVGYNMTQELLKDKSLAAQRLFLAEPSSETAKLAYMSRASTGEEPVMRFTADPEEIAQEQAELKAKSSLNREQKRVSKSKKKRNFMDYLSKQETSLGGTVGDLPVVILKEIASQYSKSQRKKMMDRMDMEDKQK